MSLRASAAERGGAAVAALDDDQRKFLQKFFPNASEAAQFLRDRDAGGSP